MKIVLIKKWLYFYKYKLININGKQINRRTLNDGEAFVTWERGIKNLVETEIEKYYA